MANTSKATKRIVDPVTGIVVEVAIEVDKEINKETRRFQTARSIQASIGINLDSAAASTIGKGKHTGNMRISMAAREYKGAVTRTAWTRQRRTRDAKSLANIDLF